MKDRIIRRVHKGKVQYHSEPYFSYRLIKHEGKVFEIRPQKDFLEVYSLKGNLLCTVTRLIQNTIGERK